MQRILEPGQIETFAQQAIPRLRLPDRAHVFSMRAERLRKLSEREAVGHAIGDYLGLMAAVVDAQQSALASVEAALPSAEHVEQTRIHGMPLVPANSWSRGNHWRNVLEQLCDSVAALPDLPATTRDVCDRLRSSQPEQIETAADALLATQTAAVDAATAPFLMAALQVYWVDLASRFAAKDVADLGVPGVCPMCGTLPVASIVRADPRSQGFRYLHCALCATEWHQVR